MEQENRPNQAAKNAHLWERHPDDWYVEPSWCNDVLFATEKFSGVIHDPACGLGRIVDAARAAGYSASGGDIVDRAGKIAAEQDFMRSSYTVDNIVSNPPFKHCNKAPYPFVRKALETAISKTALLLPLSWMTGQDRSTWLETTPLYRIYVLAPRPSMPPGPVIEAGEKPGNGTRDFAWYVWMNGFDGEAQLRWMRK